MFHPDRLAGRILGMGDVVTLAERAQEAFDDKQAAQLEESVRKGSFTLEDMLSSMRQMQKMGPMGQLMGMIPGMGGMAKEAQDAVDRGDLKRVEAIILSMTPRERREPGVLERVAPAADREGLGDLAPGGQPADQAVRRDAEADEAALGCRRQARRHGPAAGTPLGGGGAHDDRPGSDPALRAAGRDAGARRGARVRAAAGARCRRRR